MPSVEAFGSRFELSVESSRSSVKKEEFVAGRETYICSDVGEEFRVLARRTLVDPATKGKRVRCYLVLDGQDAGWFCFYGTRQTTNHTFHGWWLDGSGKRFKAFAFGSPNEDAAREGANASHLRIEIALTEAVETDEAIDPSLVYGTPDTEANAVKKPFQPHVSSGKDLQISTAPKVSLRHYEDVGHSVWLSLRYATAVGLSIRNLISPTTHPHYFSPLPSSTTSSTSKRRSSSSSLQRDDDDDVKPAVVLGGGVAAKKVKTEKREVVTAPDDDDDDVIEVFPEEFKPPTIGALGGSKDAPIVLD